MNPKSSSLRPLLLVALASFVLGVLADRVVLSSSDPDPEWGSRGSGREAKTGSTKSQDLASSARVSSKGNRDRAAGPADNSPDDEADPEHEEDGIAIQVRRVLEGLERGECIDAAIADSLLKRVPRGRHRHGVIERLAWHWGRQDPEAAAGWANELTGR